MQAYRLQGTPSLVLIDRAGQVRASHFGIVDDMALGGLIGRLIGEEGPAGPTEGSFDAGRQ
jgi:hypothetical protein